MPKHPEFRLDEAIAVLERTPVVLDAWLRGMPEGWLRADEGPDTFSPWEVLGHLVHGERTDWMARTRIIVEHGESRPFDKYDRFAQRAESEGKSAAQLLDEFAALRHANLASLAALRLEVQDLERTGTHPSLGKVTLGELLATWVAHDLTHMAQIARVMAKRYRDAIGPWRQYFRLMEWPATA
ncbi:MAG TPA: DinB family protein [Gemmatimonadales bacterium]|nr:DinB family protein [Gemmatimonadales bacterium]